MTEPAPETAPADADSRADGISTAGATPKLRSRKHGAAIPLDDADKRLMNLLQSSFPLDPEPFALLAGESGMPVDELMERTQRLLDGRFGRLRTVVEGPRGDLYVLTSNRDGRGTPSRSDDRILRITPPRD